MVTSMGDTVGALLNTLLVLFTGLLSARLLGKWGRLRHLEQLSDAASKLPMGPAREQLEARANREAVSLVRRMDEQLPPGARFAILIVVLVVACTAVFGASLTGWRGPAFSNFLLTLASGLQESYQVSQTLSLVAAIAGSVGALVVILSIEYFVLFVLYRLLPKLVRGWGASRITEACALLWGCLTAPRPRHDTSSGYTAPPPSPQKTGATGREQLGRRT